MHLLQENWNKQVIVGLLYFCFSARIEYFSSIALGREIHQVNTTE